ncbi:MAG TPA: hypothetical protein VHP36_07115 [Chitinispirillaceae bacterium]|nr:hypothetical protein [Chitinispirillaceae bacterium]
MKIKAVFLFLIVTAITMLLSCFGTEPSQSSSTGGSGSEVVGVVKYPDSSADAGNALNKRIMTQPLAGSNVFIHPASYLAEYGSQDIPKAVTDTDGFFRISNVLPGTHYVYIKDAKGNGVLREINVTDEPKTFDLGILLTEKTASARIQYSGNASDDVLFYLSLRGTGLTVACTGKGVFTSITEIPVDTDVDYMFTVQMKKPFNAGYDIKNIKLLPGVIITLDDITDNLLNH